MFSFITTITYNEKYVLPSNMTEDEYLRHIINKYRRSAMSSSFIKNIKIILTNCPLTIQNNIPNVKAKSLNFTGDTITCQLKTKVYWAIWDKYH